MNMDQNQIEQDKADVAREESELQAAKDRLATDEAVLNGEKENVTISATDVGSIGAVLGAQGTEVTAETTAETPVEATVETPAATPVETPAADPVVMPPGAAEPTDEIETPAPAVLEVPVQTPDEAEAEHAAASQAANVDNVAVAVATIEQAPADNQVGLLDELETLAVDIGGVQGERVLAVSSRMRAVLAGVL